MVDVVEICECNKPEHPEHESGRPIQDIHKATDQVDMAGSQGNQQQNLLVRETRMLQDVMHKGGTCPIQDEQVLTLGAAQSPFRFRFVNFSAAKS
jgi:hypothetical protein